MFLINKRFRKLTRDPCEGAALQTCKLLEKCINIPHPQIVYKPEIVNSNK